MFSVPRRAATFIVASSVTFLLTGCFIGSESETSESSVASNGQSADQTQTDIPSETDETDDPKEAGDSEEVADTETVEEACVRVSPFLEEKQKVFMNLVIFDTGDDYEALSQAYTDLAADFAEAAQDVGNSQVRSTLTGVQFALTEYSAVIGSLTAGDSPLTDPAVAEEFNERSPDVTRAENQVTDLWDVAILICKSA